MVMGEPAIIPGALVTLVVKVKLLKEPGPQILSTGDGQVEESEEPANKEWWVSQESKVPSAHAPYYPDVCLKKCSHSSRLKSPYGGSFWEMLKTIASLLCKPLLTWWTRRKSISSLWLLLKQAHGNSKCLSSRIPLLDLTS